MKSKVGGDRIKEKGHTLTGEKKNQFAFFLAQDALTDYISFRVLMESELFLTSIQLACSAVEKLLKSIANFLSKRDIDFRHHNVLQFYKDQSELFKTIELKLNEVVLGWLSVAYETRYTSDLKTEFSIGFSVKHLIAELDEIFFDVFSVFEKFNPLISELYFMNKDFKFIQKNNYCLEHGCRERFLQGTNWLVDILYIGNYPTFVKTELLALKTENPFYINHLDFDPKSGSVTKNIDVGTFDYLDLPPEYYLRRS